MERFNRANARTYDQSKTSSVYSNDSYKRHTVSDYAESTTAESTTSTSSRPVSIITPTPTPSYMNASVPARKPVAPKLATNRSNGTTNTTPPIELPSTFSPSSSAHPATKGILLLAIAAHPHPSTVSHMEKLLKRGTYSTVVIMGVQEQEGKLKQLKMDIYALIGRMSLQVGVRVELKERWSADNIQAIVDDSVVCGATIYGVLCSPAYGIRYSPKSEDVLALDESEFESLWISSVAFLRNVAKSTISKVTSNDYLRRGMGGYFLITGPTESEISSTTSIYKSACDSLISLLADRNAVSGLIVDYAENVLIPEPEPSPVKTNGKLHPSARPVLRDEDGYDFMAGESPTKLWNMWALQDQLGVAD